MIFSTLFVYETNLYRYSSLTNRKKCHLIYLAERCGTGWSENTETGKKATALIQYLISVNF